MRYSVSATVLTGALVLATTAANAADLPLKAPPIEVFSWNGWFIGANVGWMRGNVESDPVCGSNVTVGSVNCPILFPPFIFNAFPVPPVPGGLPGGSTSGNSVMGGGQIGYNFQSGPMVFGAEADLDATHVRAALTQNAIAPAGAAPGFFGTVTTTSALESDWVGTVRGRLGLAWNRVMLYGTGGIAFAGTTVNTAFVYTPNPNGQPGNLPGPTGANWSQVIAGWTAGVGAEWYVGERVSVAAEYRHSDFGHPNVTLGFDVNGAPITTNVHYTTDQMTLRANWHFDSR